MTLNPKAWKRKINNKFHILSESDFWQYEKKVQVTDFFPVDLNRYWYSIIIKSDLVVLLLWVLRRTKPFSDRRCLASAVRATVDPTLPRPTMAYLSSEGYGGPNPSQTDDAQSVASNTGWTLGSLADLLGPVQLLAFSHLKMKWNEMKWNFNYQRGLFIHRPPSWSDFDIPTDKISEFGTWALGHLDTWALGHLGRGSDAITSHKRRKKNKVKRTDRWTSSGL